MKFSAIILMISFIAFSNISNAQKIITIAGNGSGGMSGNGGKANQATFNSPTGSAQDAEGNVYIADNFNHVVRKIDRSGIIRIFAGTGQKGYSGDNGKAVLAQLYEPDDVKVDRSGNVYIVDQRNNVIRKVSQKGIISTVAGTGTGGFSGDGGPATNAKLFIPTSLAIDTNGVIFIADAGNERIRRIDVTGTISTYVGNGTKGNSGDGKEAINASISYVNGIAVDRTGALIFAQKDNNVIRKVNSKGRIFAFAGTGKQGYSGDGGPAINAEFNSPYGVAIDEEGNVYVSDNGNGRIRKISKKGTITTIAGNGKSGNGKGTDPMEMSFNNPTFLDITKEGDLLIADRGNNKIRKLLLCPDLNVSPPNGLSVRKGETIQLPAVVKGGHWSTSSDGVFISPTGLLKGITAGPAILSFSSPEIPYCEVVVFQGKIEVLP